MAELSILELGGLGGLLILILDLYALISVLQSDVSTGRKVLWVVVIALLPVIGFLLWLLMGPRSAARRT